MAVVPEYVENLKDEGRVCGIVDRLLTYLESKGTTEEICRVYLHRIMHTYYKFDYKAHRRSLGLQGETKVGWGGGVRGSPLSQKQLLTSSEIPSTTVRAGPGGE